jgi:hypothetical protein
MDWRQYIHSNPNILLGKPVIKGTRLSVEFLLGLFAVGWTEQLNLYGQSLHLLLNVCGRKSYTIFRYLLRRVDAIFSQ